MEYFANVSIEQEPSLQITVSDGEDYHLPPAMTYTRKREEGRGKSVRQKCSSGAGL